ncbi:MAG: hypothetical protein WA637_00220 [Terriglobales bacterium]
MKRIGYVVLAEAVLAGMLVTLAGAQSQSLGDYARSVRKDEKPASAKKYDNDNLPTSDKISVVGNATESTGAEDANPGSTSGENSAQPQDGATPSTPEAQDANKKADGSDAQKANDEWKQKIAQQQNQVDLLTRELDVTQREYRLRAAAFYADAGNRLRGSGTWDKEDAQYKQQIAQKQKALDDAKKALDDMKEQARKAGVPAKLRQ